MDDNNQTSGQPKPEPEECVKEQKITDHFKIMIDKARKAQKLVLIKRADDLLRWEHRRNMISVRSLVLKEIRRLI
ncbi:hypothetical protein [Escherichia coli]|uniref:hypothetical protein n=1 Tax=Escherichia coli TaxID=562 RepID=UPI001F0E95D2|nr:hypothetical protein [Escherichia coli]